MKDTTKNKPNSVLLWTFNGKEPLSYKVTISPLNLSTLSTLLTDIALS